MVPKPLPSSPSRSWLSADNSSTSSPPPRAKCCLQFSAQALADQLQEWNQLGRYRADNASLLPEAGRVVFYGDSITDSWKLPQSFPSKPYVNHGISGQTSRCSSVCSPTLST